MDKVLKIYELVGTVETPFPNSTLQAELYSFQYDCKRMGNAPTITGTIMYPLCLDNLWNDNVFVDLRGEKYFIDLTPSSSYSNADTRYKHELVFVSERRILETKIFTDGVLTEFRFFGDLNMLVQRLNDFFVKEGLSYSVVVDTGITTEEKDVDIKNMYVNDVLLYGFELFNIPYYFKGKEIHFGHYENEITEVFEYGVDNALLAVNKENSNNKVITRITGVGSSDNIPYYYPNFNESGEHVVTTTPSGYQTQISKLNYLKIDPYTNLRNGGWAKYHKACVNPIGDDTENIVLKVTNETSYKTESEAFSIDGNFSPRTSYYIENGYKYYYNDNIYVQIEIHKRGGISGGYKEISNILKIEYAGESFYTDIKASDILEVKGIYTSSSSSVDGFFSDVEENLSYNSFSTYIRIFTPRFYHTIRVKLKFPLRGEDYILNQSLLPYNCSFLYDNNYFNSQRNLKVGWSHFYNDYNEIINFTNGTDSYDASYVYAVTREVAGYSTVYLDTIFRGMFLDANGNGLTEWYKFKPSDVVIKDSYGNDVTERWFDSVNEYIHFRNTSEYRTVYTITMTVSVNMTTPENTTAYGVKLYYNPDLGRYELPYDYWKFHDGKEIKYDICGIKFANKDTIPDSLSVNFSATKNWIDPKPYLMPKVYRDTLGKNIWYNAENGKHTDESGQYITFVNEYNPDKSKEHISDPKDDIKPTIVGVTNANDERIDQFADVAFDTNDNNDEWITDENGDNQELKHSFFFVKLRKMEFNLFDQALETGEMTISMTSGHCGRCNFTIMVDEETQQNTVQVDENGNLVRDDEGNVITYGTPQPQQQDTTQNEVWIALRKEEDSYGEIMPDNDKGLVPIAGQDTFVLTNILLPNSYIENAEQKLEYELLKDLKENNEDKFNFSIDFSRIYLAENQNILSLLNENSKLYVKYNGETNELYVNSYTYKMDNNTPLPEIKVELKKSIVVIKNVIQRNINRVEVTFNKAIIKLGKDIESVNRSNNNSVTIVQETGNSTTSVMSQKAVTNELAKIPEISQNLGSDSTKTISQRTITENFNNINNIITQIQVGSDSEKICFDGIIYFDEDVNIIQQSTSKDKGLVFYHEATNAFIFRPFSASINPNSTDNNITLSEYYISWNNVYDYNYIADDGTLKARTDKWFIYTPPLGKIAYIWNGESIETITLSEKKEIPIFNGIIDTANILPATGYNKNGEVWFIKKAIVNSIVIPNIFVYKVRDTYYQHWSNEQDYNNVELSEAITNKLFSYNNQQYIYIDKVLDLLSNIGKIVWNQF